MKGCCLILSCSKEKYTQDRYAAWNSSIKGLADHIPIFYLFGKSTENISIPDHNNAHSIIAPCGDNYEDIPMKIYYGIQYLKSFNYDYIIKLDDNIQIKDISTFINIINDEILTEDYIALKGIAGSINDHNTNIIVHQYSHTGKVNDKKLNIMPSILLNIKYAGGPAYVLSRRAYNLINYSIMNTNLYEDYAIGLNLQIENIRVFSSNVIKLQLIHDNDNNINQKLYFTNTIIESDRKVNEILKYNNELMSKKRQSCYVYISGGLGNQLFQIANGLEFAFKNNLEIKLIPSSENPRSYYWNSDQILHNCQKWLDVPRGEVLIYEEPSFAFTEIPSPPPNENIMIKGYFQSPQYFPSFIITFKNFLSFPTGIEKYILDKYGNIFTPDHVVIHARRGDYLKYSEIHRPLTEEYYSAAISTIKANKYILISDDPQFWNSDSVSLGNTVERITFNEDEITTLYLMSKSHNLIIANSSFSWWGAFLAGPNAQVVAPAKWFGPAGPPVWKDIYMPQWKIL